MDLLRTFPGADAILAARTLPQPDQLCGPFAAAAALSAFDQHVSLLELAHASGTRIWPYDVPAGRPRGAPLVRVGWDELPIARTPNEAGTTADGLAAGIEATTAVRVVPVKEPTTRQLTAILDMVAVSERPMSVLANLHTSGVVVSGHEHWSVGHFVVVWGMQGARVALADSYRELGSSDLPDGCRLVEIDAFSDAMAGRGLLILVDPADLDTVTATLDQA